MVAGLRLPFELNPLDSKFVPAKPKNSAIESAVTELEKHGRLIITRKRDGYRIFAVRTKQGVKLYSRGLEDLTNRFPHIVAELLQMPIPENSLLDGEMVYAKAGKDDYSTIAKLIKLNPDTSIKLQQTVGHASYIVFGIIVSGEEDVTNRSNRERLRMVFDLFPSNMALKHVFPVEEYKTTLSEMKKMVLEREWEGLVLYDAAKPTTFKLDGRQDEPPRPNGCWKWKPRLEDDFIVRKWEYGTGKNKNRMGKLFLLQVDPRTKKETTCGEVGGGFTDAERENFAVAEYPLVVQVEFQGRFKSWALRHPVFVRLREDKKPEECLLPVEVDKKPRKK